MHRIGRELQIHGGSSHDISIQGLPISNLLASHGVHQIHYLSIDIEGGELEILNSLATDRFDVLVIGVENNYRNFRIPRLLKRRGYKFHSIAGDEFYVKDQL